ncbi:hypothetical protein MJH12_10740 [bacterium]|nr:hypothetical protein [bacterium]
MRNTLFNSLILAIILHSPIVAANNFFDGDQNFQSFEQTRPSKSLRLRKIKEKLNRLKRKSSSKKTNQNFQNEQVSQMPENTPRQMFHENIQEQAINRFSSNNSRRAFSKRKPNENAGYDIELRSSQGQKARQFYANRCEQFIGKIAIEYKLDKLLDLQGKYLSLKGRHREANRFITLAYQQAPSSLDTNMALIENLVSLGQRNMAEEMLLFYIDDKGIQNLKPREHKSLKQLHQRLRRMQ